VLSCAVFCSMQDTCERKILHKNVSIMPNSEHCTPVCISRGCTANVGAAEVADVDTLSVK